MKVLILSCNTGQGHNTAARAVVEELARRGVECEMRDALAFFGELASKLVSEGYIRMATDAPKMFGSVYRFSEVISNPRVKSPVYVANMTYTRKLGRYIREQNFDVVLTSHIFPAQALTHLKKHGQIAAKIGFIATDYTCYPFSEETDMDWYFVAHRDVAPEYAERGVAREKLHPTGIPVSKRFAEHADRKEAREKLGIPQEGTVFLIMTGSMGFGSTAPLAEAIAKEKDSHLVYVMTGRNEEMKREIDALHEVNPRVSAVPFTTEVPLYMSAADVLMTKPGGLTTTEAAVAQIPTVLSAPIPGCETANTAFFEQHGLAVCAQDSQAAAHAALWLAADADKRSRMLEAQGREINARAAADICDVIGCGGSR